MVGRESSKEYYHITKQAIPDDEIVLRAQDLGLFGCFKHVSFELRKGEILARCGVVGSGNEDICACLCGDKKPTSGTIEVFGKPVHMKTPAEALALGILSVPKWRNEEGVMSMLSVAENITLSNFENIKLGLLLSNKKQTEHANEWVKKFNIKCADVQESVQQLSGGNVQKVVFARVLASGAKIVILNHPTRGVDIGAKEEIYSLIRTITQSGFSVILLGDTLEECIGLANNIIVLKDGYVTKTFSAPPDDKPEQAEIVRHMV
jgi:ribose transport system ATP-binding protein